MHIVFFSPLYLYLALLGASIPVIIHLLNRAKRRKIVFSSVYILEEVLRKSRSNLALLKRWQKILLILTRSTILFLLGILLAEPWLSSVGRGNNSPNGEHNFVFLFDVSASRSVKLPFIGENSSSNTDRVFTSVDNDKRIALKISELLQRKLPYDFSCGVVTYAREIENQISMNLSDSGGIFGYRKIFSDPRMIVPTQKGTSHSKGIEAAIKMIEEKSSSNPSFDGSKMVESNFYKNNQKKSVKGTIFWFTDLASHGFLEKDNGIVGVASLDKNSRNSKISDIVLPEGVNLVVISPNNISNYPNLSIEGIETTDKKKVSQGFFDVLVRSYNFNGPAFLRLYWIQDLSGKGGRNNEKIIFDMPVHIKENQINRIRCFMPPSAIMSLSNEVNFKNGGSFSMQYLFRIEIRGDEFYLTDNSYYFRMNNLESGYPLGVKEGRLNVLIVDGNPEPGRLSNVFYVESALKASDIVGSARTITSGDFIKEWDVSYGREFLSYDAIIFSDFWPDIPYITNIEDTNPLTVNSLKNFCRQYLENDGKVVIFFPGERLNLNAGALGTSYIADINAVRFYPSSSYVNTRSPTRANNDNEGRRVNLRIDENLLEEILGFKKSAEFDWDIKVNKLHTISYDGEGFLTLSSALEDNIPFILCKRQSKGVFFFINTTSNRRWSDFCSKAVFPVLMEKMVGAGLHNNRRGEGLDGDVYGFVGETPLVMENANIGDKDFLKKLFYYDGDKATPLAIPPQKVGIYPIKSDKDRSRVNFYFVNFPHQESDLSVLDEKQVFRRIGRGGNSNIYFVRYDMDAILKAGGRISSNTSEDIMSSSRNNEEVSKIVTRAVALAVGKDIKKEIVAVILILIVVENVLSGGSRFFAGKKS